jgi:hypothetical protein
MMSIVSNTAVDIVARGVIKACLELGKDPGETIAIFRIPGAWEEEGFKILDRYGRRVLRPLGLDVGGGGRAVAKIQGAPGVSILLEQRHRPSSSRASPGVEAVNLTRECLDYGSKVVGGVDARAERAARSTACRSSTPSPRRREPRRPGRRLGRHRPPRLHQGRRCWRRSRTGSS